MFNKKIFEHQIGKLYGAREKNWSTKWSFHDCHNFDFFCAASPSSFFITGDNFKYLNFFILEYNFHGKKKQNLGQEGTKRVELLPLLLQGGVVVALVPKKGT